jgi:hypothetical protein
MLAARREAHRLQGEAEAALAEAEDLKLQARLEDLTVCEVEKIKQTRKGSTPGPTGWPHGAKARGCTMCTGELQDDGYQGCIAEGQETESLGRSELNLANHRRALGNLLVRFEGIPLTLSIFMYGGLDSCTLAYCVESISDLY